MKTRLNPYLGTLLVIAMTQPAHAVDITWDSLGVDDNWSTFDNWSDDLTPANDDVTFNNDGGAAGTTVTSIVDTSYSIDSLNFRQDNTVNHTLSIPGGQMLTVVGSFTPTAGEATAVLFGQPSDAGTLASTTHITGLGTFTVNSATSHFLVGYANATGNPTITANMSGLSNFNATVDIFGVGRKGTISTNAARQQAGVLTLTKNNTITANEISVGSTTHIGGTTGTHNNGGTSTLNLGSGGSAVNNLYADKMSFGIGKATGNMNFATGVVASDTVTIRAKNTIGAVGTFEIAVRNMSSSSGTPSGTVNFGAGKVDALMTNLNVGQWANGAGTSGVNPTGTFTMGTNAASTVTVTTLNLANSGSATNPGSARVVTGSLNVTGGVFSATTVNMATGTATAVLTKTANLTVDGGTFRFGTFGAPTGTNVVTINFNSGTVSSIDATNRSLGLAYNLGKVGGSTVTFGQASGGTGTLTLSSTGTLIDNTTLTTLVDTTLSGAIDGGFSITKNGIAKLTLSGTNLHTGGTMVSGGTLGVSMDANLGTAPGSATAGSLVIDGGILSATTGFTLNSNRGIALGSSSASTGGTMDVASSQTLGYGGIIADNGGTNSLTKTGPGILTLSGANSYTGGTVVSGGVLTFLNTNAKPASGTHAFDAGTTIGLGVATSGSFFTAADITNAFSGSMTANLSNVTVSATTNVGIDTSNGDFAYGDSITGSPTKGLTKLGANIVTLSGTNTYSGATTISAGTLSVSADVNLGTAPGAATVGHLVINGGTLYATTGFTLNSNRGIALGSSTASTGGTMDVAGSQTLSYGGMIANNGGTNSLTKTGAGTLILSGTNTYTGTTTVRGGGTLKIDATGSINPTTGAALTIGSGSGNGTLQYDSSGNSKFGAIQVGTGTSASGTLNQTAGTIYGTSLTLNNGYSGSGTGNVTLSGGGNITISGATILSNATAGDNVLSTFTISGASTIFNANGDLRLTGVPASGRNANGKLIQNDGTVNVAGTNGLLLVQGTSGNTAIRRGQYDLNGGTLNVNTITSTSTATADAVATFNFNGGTLKPTASSATFWINNSQTIAKVQAGGAFIDDGGFAITIAQPLIHDSALGVTPDGGLTKSGSSTLILSGANTYTGNTTVSAGTLELAATTGSLTFAPGANNVSNKVTGAGTATFNGTFNIDLTNAAVADNNSWVLADVSSKAFDLTTFTVAGFSELPEGTWTLVDGNKTWTFTQSDATLRLAVAAAAGYDNWLTLYPGILDPAAGADPDNDGIKNLLEYVLNGNPTLSDPAILPDLDASGENFVFTFTRREQSTSDTTQIFQYSTNLTSWTDISITGTPGSEVTLGVPAGGLQAVTVTISKSAAGPGGKLFGRLQAVKLP